MNTFRCLIVDDEPPALEILRHYIASTPMLEIKGECHHALAAYEFLRNNEVDLMFLDIQMPQILGTQLLQLLSHPPKVIFTTAYRDYAVEGFELGAIDYLLKPYPFDRFLKAVHKVLQLDQQMPVAREPAFVNSERFLYVKADRKMVKVLIDEIRYVESLKDYVRIHTGNQSVITKQTISALEEMLPRQDFMRIHRSFIVATRKIDSYNQHAVFTGKTELPVGPLYRLEIMKRLAGLSAAGQ